MTVAAAPTMFAGAPHELTRATEPAGETSVAAVISDVGRGVVVAGVDLAAGSAWRELPLSAFAAGAAVIHAATSSGGYDDVAVRVRTLPVRAAVGDRVVLRVDIAGAGDDVVAVLGRLVARVSDTGRFVADAVALDPMHRRSVEVRLSQDAAVLCASLLRRQLRFSALGEELGGVAAAGPAPATGAGAPGRLWGEIRAAVIGPQRFCDAAVALLEDLIGGASAERGWAAETTPCPVPGWATSRLGRGELTALGVAWQTGEVRSGRDAAALALLASHVEHRLSDRAAPAFGRSVVASVDDGALILASEHDPQPETTLAVAAAVLDELAGGVGDVGPLTRRGAAAMLLGPADNALVAAVSRHRSAWERIDRCAAARQVFDLGPTDLSAAAAALGSHPHVVEVAR